MTAAEIRAKQFWSAAYFIRRAPERNPAIALQILEEVANKATGQIQRRAALMLREVSLNGYSDTPRAS